MRGDKRRIGSEVFPFGPVDACFSEDCAEKISTDIALMRVWNTQAEIFSDHELMFTTRIWTGKAKLAQEINQLVALNRSEWRHYATSSCLFKSMLLMIGIVCPIFSPRMIHSSRTS